MRGQIPLPEEINLATRLRHPCSCSRPTIAPILLRHVKYASNGVIEFGRQWQETTPGLLLEPPAT
ncbi:hypothetical protein [Stenotrophomonas maltophilia]|uniref:hypothetical protein n=1 Tax=Stenotrophomonas maltophilia TaxID=40324 RepID=UPI000C2684EB|nr:hypothetical protein [Stenotrophomonas maltophilia]PJL57389.1 hypothetical protein B9Y82_01030 [Stenotrophomonas maltophilia]